MIPDFFVNLRGQTGAIILHHQVVLTKWAFANIAFLASTIMFVKRPCKHDVQRQRCSLRLRRKTLYQMKAYDRNFVRTGAKQSIKPLNFNWQTIIRCIRKNSKHV